MKGMFNNSSFGSHQYRRHHQCTLAIIAVRKENMISIDIRLKDHETKILQATVGNTLENIKHDTFIFSNTSSQAVKIDMTNASFYLYSFTEPLDYYGSQEDVAVWSIEEKTYPLITNKSFINTPIKEKVVKTQIVQEHQMLFENSRQTYDIWLTRGIIFNFGEHEVAFEKPVWFSEDIVIWKGYDLIEKFQPVENICKTEKWKDGARMECSRKVITL